MILYSKTVYFQCTLVNSNIMKHPTKILTFLLITLIACKNTEPEKAISNLEFEQKVFEQVFINVVDSTYTNKRIYTRIPTKAQENDPDFLAEINAIEKDTLNLIIAVDKRFTDVEKLNTQKFIFKDFNELPKFENYTNWTEKYKKFIGVMSFSYITFDKTKENGSLEVSYRCGANCGLGYKVYLKKINGKWKVVKIEDTWIS